MRIRLHVQRSPFLRFAVHSHERFYIFLAKKWPVHMLVVQSVQCNAANIAVLANFISRKNAVCFEYTRQEHARPHSNIRRKMKATDTGERQHSREAYRIAEDGEPHAQQRTEEIKNKNFSRIKYVFALFLELTAQTYTPASCEKEANLLQLL